MPPRSVRTAAVVDRIGPTPGSQHIVPLGPDGAAEVGYVLALAVRGPGPSPEQLTAWTRGARVSLCVRYAVPVERLFASIGHLGSDILEAWFPELRFRHLGAYDTEYS